MNVRAKIVGDNDNKSKGYFDEEQDRKKDMISETAVKYVFEKMKKRTIEDYYALPDEERVELIDGVFFDMEAPGLAHQTAALSLASALKAYVKKKQGKCNVFISQEEIVFLGLLILL